MKNTLKIAILLLFTSAASGQYGLYRSPGAIARHGTPTAAKPADSPGHGTYSGAQTVSITTATSGATICYTVDVSTPTASTPGTCSHGTTYSGAFTSPSSTFTLKAIATKAAFINSGLDTSVYTINPPAATPIDSPGTGVYAGAQTITITTATSGARICYTTDGSTPTATTPGTCSHGTSYVSSFTSPSSTFTLKALATKSGFVNSSTDTSTYTINATAATPVDSPGTGTYPSAQTVSISTGTAGATICYTLDGSTPAASTPGTCSAGTTYSSAFTSPGSTFTLKALTTKTGFFNSGIDTSTYTIDSTVATPVDSPGAGTYAVAQTITITTATPGVTICYTVDGSTPASSTPGTCSAGTTYSGAFTSPTSTFTLKALATKAGFINSAVDTSVYTINTRTFPAADCSQSAVQAAITAEQVSPADGDIIAIPACSSGVTWTSSITQAFANSVTIQGAGAISATTGGSSTTGTDQTVILDGYNSTSPLFRITTIAGKSFRMTGIAILQNSSTPSVKYGMVELDGTSISVRIDHSHFYSYISGNKDINVYAYEGVFDHDYFDALTSIVTNDIAFQNGGGWNGGTDPNGYGNSSWTDGDHFGSSEFLFAEDDRFNNGWAGDCSVGGRYVLRYSTSVTAAMEQHGTNDTYRGCRTSEVYEDTFTYNQDFSGGIVQVQSGASLVWGNTVTAGYYNVVSVADSRQNPGSYPEVAPPNGLGYCGNSFSGSTSSWDQNTTTNGYACLDQPGRGSGDLITGTSFPSIINSVLGGQTWPREVLDPLYVWDNTFSGSARSVIGDGTVGGIMTDNQDYYQQFGTFGEPGSFNGTKGVGQGLFSGISTTCTPGVGYWATDRNTLYLCGPAANTWSAYYTPYTYPHPLNH